MGYVSGGASAPELTRTVACMSAIELSASLRSDLLAPVIVAPMFLVSGPELVISANHAGLMGSFPTQNARELQDLIEWLDQIRTGLAGAANRRWAASMIVHKSYDRFEAELELMQEYQPDVVVTALGPPSRVIDEVHGYGGAVFADVMSVEHARKAGAHGADGLELVCHGAGGHTGRLSPFAFVDEVRRFFDGVLVVGGAISGGRGVRAAEVLGADLVYMGTRFIACPESLVVDRYREMLVRADASGVTATAAVTGVLCNWLGESLAEAGYDETSIAATGKLDFTDVHGEHKPWKDIFGAGQSVGMIDRVAPLAEVAAQIAAECRQTVEESDSSFRRNVLPLRKGATDTRRRVSSGM
jgi:nitronate monooxygenase